MTRLTVRRRDLFHWTCEHGADAIRRDGMVVKPHLGLSWWTDMDKADRHTRAACVLTSNTIKCDRMQYRCRAVSFGLLIPWSAYAVDADPAFVETLEQVPGADPSRWWVASEPVPVSSVRYAR